MHALPAWSWHSPSGIFSQIYLPHITSWMHILCCLIVRSTLPTSARSTHLMSYLRSAGLICPSDPHAPCHILDQLVWCHLSDLHVPNRLQDLHVSCPSVVGDLSLEPVGLGLYPKIMHRDWEERSSHTTGIPHAQRSVIQRRFKITGILTNPLFLAESFP